MALPLLLLFVRRLRVVIRLICEVLLLSRKVLFAVARKVLRLRLRLVLLVHVLLIRRLLVLLLVVVRLLLRQRRLLLRVGMLLGVGMLLRRDAAGALWRSPLWPLRDAHVAVRGVHVHMDGLISVLTVDRHRLLRRHGALLAMMRRMLLFGAILR